MVVWPHTLRDVEGGQILRRSSPLHVAASQMPRHHQGFRKGFYGLSMPRGHFSFAKHTLQYWLVTRSFGSSRAAAVPVQATDRFDGTGDAAKCERRQSAEEGDVTAKRVAWAPATWDRRLPKRREDRRGGERDEGGADRTDAELDVCITSDGVGLRDRLWKGGKGEVSCEVSRLPERLDRRTLGLSKVVRSFQC